MNGGENFFKEDAFGEIYNGSFFADDVKKFSSATSNSNKNESAAMNAAVSQVRMSTEVDVGRESSKAIRSIYELGGNLGGGVGSNFAGRIFGNV